MGNEGFDFFLLEKGETFPSYFGVFMQVHFISLHEKQQTCRFFPLILSVAAPQSKCITPSNLGPHYTCANDWNNPIAFNLFYFFDDLSCFLKIGNFFDDIVHFGFEVNVESNEVFALADKLFVLKLFQRVELEGSHLLAYSRLHL